MVGSMGTLELSAHNVRRAKSLIGRGFTAMLP
jgi:hypothetical protein